MEKLLNKIQEQLDNGWAVEADDIQALVNFFRNNDKHVSLKYKLDEILSKYWYDTEYQHIKKTEHKKCENSRKNFRKWVDNNIKDFLI